MKERTSLMERALYNWIIEVLRESPTLTHVGQKDSDGHDGRQRELTRRRRVTPHGDTSWRHLMASFLLVGSSSFSFSSVTCFPFYSSLVFSFVLLVFAERRLN